MGFLLGGPFFHLRGRTGNNVGRVVKGKNVFSMRPTPSEKPPTALQLDQRLRFGLFTSWLSRVTPVLDIGFASFESKMSPYNAAVAYNLQHAVTGVSPNFSINYPEVQFSQGKLKMPSNVAIAAGADAAVTLSWADVAGAVNSDPTDKIGVVVYNVEQQEFVMHLDAALRSAEEYELQLPLDWIDDVVESWLLAVSADGETVSNTAYVGQLTVVA